MKRGNMCNKFKSKKDNCLMQPVKEVRNFISHVIMVASR